MPTQLELFPQTDEEVELDEQHAFWLNATDPNCKFVSQHLQAVPQPEYVPSKEDEAEYEEWLCSLDSDDRVDLQEASFAASESFNWQEAIDDPDKPF